MATQQEIIAQATKEAARVGLPGDLFLRQMKQESGFNPEAVSKVGAQGLMQIMPNTAASPGHGVTPLRDASWQENIRFGADYMAAMLRETKGNYAHALAAYNAGLGTVRRAGGVPRIAETQDYIQRILGAHSASIRPDLSGQPEDTVGLAQGAYNQDKADQAKRDNNKATNAEAFQYGVVHNLFGSALDSYYAPPAEAGYTPDMKAAADRGLFNYPEQWEYLQNATSPQDFDNRMNRVQLDLDTQERLSNRSGADGWLAQAVTMGGGFADPIGFAAAVAGGGALRLTKIARAMQTTAVGRAALNVTEGAVTNMGIDAALQLNNHGSVHTGELIESGLFGAAFGGVASVAGLGRAAREAADFHAYGKGSAALREAVAAGLPEESVNAITRNLDDIKLRMIERAGKEGDVAAAEAMSMMGPGSDVNIVREAIKARRLERDAALHGTDPSAVGTARNMAAGDAEISVGAVRLSDEASNIWNFAHNIWDEKVPASLEKMQARQRAWQETATGLAGYKNLKEYLDSPGLVLQRSKSKVARMLGAHLAESATGLGKREQTAALNYEIWHSRLSHESIPELKAVEAEHLKSLGWKTVLSNKVLGGAGKDTREFWRAVQQERLAHREAIKAKQEFVSKAPRTVRDGAKLLDEVVRKGADLMIANGIPEGEAIKAGGYVGHVPYRWNNAALLNALREDPAAFQAIGHMLQDQFEKKILAGTWAGMTDKAPELIEQRKASAQNRIETLQNEIANHEQARKELSHARDVERDAIGMKKQHAEQLKMFDAEVERLKQELADAEAKAEAAEAVFPEETQHVGAVELPYAGPDKLSELRANPAYVESNSGTVVKMIDRVADMYFQPDEKVLWGALKSQLRNQDIPVFLQSGPKLHNSKYLPDAHAVVLTNLFDNTKLATSEAREAMHELVHAVTSRWLLQVKKAATGKFAIDQWGAPLIIREPIKGIPDSVVRAHNTLEQIRGKLMELYPELIGKKEDVIGYAMYSSQELLSQTFQFKRMRETLRGIEMHRNVPLLRKVWEAVANVLGFGPKDTGLSAVIGAMDHLTEHVGVWKDLTGKFDIFAGDRTPGVIRGELEHVTKMAEAERVKLAAARVQAKAGKQVAQKVRATDPAKKIANLELQLSRAKADLSDIQADPLGWFGKQIQGLQKEARAKSSALTSNYLHQILKDPKSRTNSIPLHIAQMAEDLLNENWKGTTVAPELAQEFGNLLRERLADRTRTELDLTATSKLHDGREVSLLDYLDTDGLSMAKSFNHTAAGSSALGRMGIKDRTAIEAAIEAARLDGATDQELESLRHLFELFSIGSGTPDSPAMHALRNLTYSTRMGKLGLSMIGDIPAVMMNMGVANGMRVLAKSLGQASLTGTRAFSGAETAFMRQLAIDAPGLLGREHRLMTLIPDNPATGMPEPGGMSNLQRFSARGAQFTSVISGANMVDRMLHRAVTPILAEEMLAELATPMALDSARLADLGLYPDRVARIQAELTKHDVGRVRGDRVNWDKWEDQEAADYLVGAIHRGVHQALQKTLHGEKPAWMTDSALGRLIGQFRTFGFTAAEKSTSRLLLGRRDQDAMLGAVVGIMWAGTIYAARVQLNAAGRKDREKYIRDNLAPQRLVPGTLSLWNASGLSADFANIGASMFGGMGQTTQAGPAVGVLGDVAKAAAAPVVAFTDGPAKAAGSVIRILPGANSVPATLLLNQMLH